MRGATLTSIIITLSISMWLMQAIVNVMIKNITIYYLSALGTIKYISLPNTAALPCYIFTI